MGVLVFSRTINATAGLHYVSSPGGVSVLEIVAVHRTGAQYDKVSIGSLNDGVTRQWAYNNFSKRIQFPTAVPFNTDEKVHVIYKTIV
jgi:hypothetical protein